VLSGHFSRHSISTTDSSKPWTGKMRTELEYIKYYAS
jgi:hypothetical protein